MNLLVRFIKGKNEVLGIQLTSRNESLAPGSALIGHAAIRWYFDEIDFCTGTHLTIHS